MKILFNPIEGIFDITGSTSGPAITTNSFETIQTPFGTSLVADSPTDVLTMASSDIGITGNALTDTITYGILNNAVTNDKLAQMPANTIKGNNTASTANAADLTIAEVKVMLNVLDLVSYSQFGGF